MEDQQQRTAQIDAITQKIGEAADRLRPITAALNRGDASRIGESNRIQREIARLYERRDELRAGPDQPSQL
jgi:hypothetical protein